MNSTRHLASMFLYVLFTVFAMQTAAAAVAETRTRFVRLGPGVPAVLYEPASDSAKGQIGILAMHSGADYLAHSACTELSRRGYHVLCANNSLAKSGVHNDGDIYRIVREAGLGVAWLRANPAISKVVLLGHSGGGALMSAYQAIAENGPQICQTPQMLLHCADDLARLPRADGVMLIDSNWGLPAMTLFSIDPAVRSESGGRELDPSLDLFNPRNGFNAAGSTYSAAFVSRFQQAVGQRYRRLVDAALTRSAAIAAGRGRFVDDEPFVVPGGDFKGGNNRLFSQDVRLMSRTRKAWPLLRADGSRVTQIVSTVRVPENAQSRSQSFAEGALNTTVRHFLSTYALRISEDFSFGENSVQGVDWSSSMASPPGNVANIKVPLLVMGMTAHWEFLAAETIHERAASADKTLVFVEGANHGFQTCARCERKPGQFGNTQQTTYDFIDGWLSAAGRFL